MTTNTSELKSRIEAKIKEMEARLLTMKADTQAKASDESEKLKTRLADVKESIKDGWDNVTDKVAAKLNDWLKN